MSDELTYRIDTATADVIAKHLTLCDRDFVPPLSGRIGIEEYAKKIANFATRFEVWSAGTLVGLVAVYCNDMETRVAHVTSVSVLREWSGEGVATHLMGLCIRHAQACGMSRVRLEVNRDNAAAIRLYQKLGFIAGEANTSSIIMDVYMKSGE
jgi:ribosomal protein S18 acetylase RimI-like enzyme